MARIRAGKLDRVVEIHRRGDAAHDGYSLEPGAWQPVASRRVSVQPARGREVQEGEGRSGLALMSFWMRYDSVTSAITERDSLVLGGRRYEIAAPPMEIGRREGIEIFANAGELADGSEAAA